MSTPNRFILCVDYLRSWYLIIAIKIHCSFLDDVNCNISHYSYWYSSWVGNWYLWPNRDVIEMVLVVKGYPVQCNRIVIEGFQQRNIVLNYYCFGKLFKKCEVSVLKTTILRKLGKMKIWFLIQNDSFRRSEVAFSKNKCCT